MLPCRIYILFEERKTKRVRRVPRAPKYLCKSAPPISRCFPHRLLYDRPQLVSFKAHDESFLHTKYYDESSHELFFDQCFTLDTKIGEGSFGEVFRVRSKEDGQLYAIKRALEPFRNMWDRNKKLDEVHRHESVSNHPNLVRFVRAWEERGRLYIQTELCETSLEMYTEKNHCIPTWQVWHFFVDLLQALEYIHRLGLIHLDVKPGNIFVTSAGVCKLGDFGLAVQLTTPMMEPDEGDAKYLAPELLCGQFSQSADVFSLGLTILEIATDLDPPLRGESWHKLRLGNLPVIFAPIVHQEKFAKRFFALPESLRTFICAMMDPDPKRRPTVRHMLSTACVVRRARWRRCCLKFNSLKDAVCSLLAVIWLYVTILFNLPLHVGRHLNKSLFMWPTGGTSSLFDGTHRHSDSSGRNGCFPLFRTKPRGLEPRALDDDPSFSDDELIGDVSSIHDSFRKPEDLSQVISPNRPPSTIPMNCEDDFMYSDFDDGSFLLNENSPNMIRPWKSTPVQKPPKRMRVLSPALATHTPPAPSLSWSFDSGGGLVNRSYRDRSVHHELGSDSPLQTSARPSSAHPLPSASAPFFPHHHRDDDDLPYTRMSPKKLCEEFDNTSSSENDDF